MSSKISLALALFLKNRQSLKTRFFCYFCPFLMYSYPGALRLNSQGVCSVSLRLLCLVHIPQAHLPDCTPCQAAADSICSWFWWDSPKGVSGHFYFCLKRYSPSSVLWPATYMSSAVSSFPVFPVEAASHVSNVLKFLWVQQSMWEKQKGLFNTLLQMLRKKEESLAADTKYSIVF